MKVDLLDYCVKVKRIVLSRFRKEKEEKWVAERRKTCKGCPFNTLNLERVPIKQKIINFLSDGYTWITNSKSEDLGACSVCGCDLFYKTRESEENCPKEKW